MKINLLYQRLLISEFKPSSSKHFALEVPRIAPVIARQVLC